MCNKCGSFLELVKKGIVICAICGSLIFVHNEVHDHQIVKVQFVKNKTEQIASATSGLSAKIFNIKVNLL